MKIITAIITPIPKDIFDRIPEVIVTFEDMSTKTLFTFYPDELTFLSEEFIGLTEEEAHHLRQRKDIAYLQS